MTIEFRSPRTGDESRLRDLFTEAFGDAAFTDLFFRTGYAPEQCLMASSGEILAALHWFDCTLEGQKAAYLYGIATFEAHRGLGIASRLIRSALTVLEAQGYGPVFLVPAEESLFGYYERLGFRPVSTIQEFFANAGTPLPLRKLTVTEYAEMRKRLLPEHSLLQEGACLDLFGAYADFYATDRSLCAVTDHMVWELLGDVSEASGILAALELPCATVRTPGTGRPFAMAVKADRPVYLGLAFD